MKKFYEDKVILVTGAVGSIGSALVKKLLEFNPKTIRALDINESGLFYLTQELKSEKIRSLVGDIRDKERLERAVEGVDVIFHAAALKHVPLCEMNPFEAVKTNVLGTKNLIETALNEEVDKFITISTDKAVNPINVLGASKLLAERLTVSANFYKGKRKTVFSCVRFGNVLNSNGSVLPIFKRQLESGGPVKVTDKNMTRFIMSIEKAIQLVLKTAMKSHGGEIFILKMPSLRINDLAAAVIEEYSSEFDLNPKDVGIEYIGKRDGEKMHEELMNEDEAEMVIEDDEMFILSPLKSNKAVSPKKGKQIYRSKDDSFMSIKDIRKLIRELSN